MCMCFACVCYVSFICIYAFLHASRVCSTLDATDLRSNDRRRWSSVNVYMHEYRYFMVLV